ncbi:class I SAM-dependent DNA methyltransferase [Legionella pneumophila]|uniref:class I SAM-dependent DNA methyltransferase n=1 Tax=Legionella pneumophila TaxID=446 RepID=UPI003A4C54B2
MTKSLDTYLDLCTQVYDLSKPTPPKDAYDFYLSYVRETNGPILEPMCGTGRYLLPLHAEGFPIEGFDASQAMLKALHTKAKRQNINPHVWHGFMEDLKISKQYDLIFIPSGSFGLIVDLTAIKNALKTIYNLLSDKGMFVFEVETLKAVPKELGIWRGSRWQRPDNKIILSSQLAMLEESICYSIGKYELVDSNRVVQTEIEEYKIRIYDAPSLLVNILIEIGFKDIQLLKAFDRNSLYEEHDETIVYECRK